MTHTKKEHIVFLKRFHCRNWNVGFGSCIHLLQDFLGECFRDPMSIILQDVGILEHVDFKAGCTNSFRLGIRHLLDVSIPILSAPSQNDIHRVNDDCNFGSHVDERIQ
jgi:hypothetical protein